MSNQEQYLADARAKTKEDFIQLYPHPFLVQYAESSSSGEADKKLVFSTITVKRLDDLLKMSPVKKAIKNIFPVLKSSRNPFASKITVGRTSVQDIVIEDVSISKFHAYFESKDGLVFTISDRGSTNGSKIDGDVLEASVPQMVRDRAVISFAGLQFTFYTARTAYEVFRDL